MDEKQEFLTDEKKCDDISQSGYRKIDLSKLTYSDEILSFYDVLVDVDPIETT